MRIYKRPTNVNEIYCFQVKNVKNTFSDTQVRAFFGSFAREYKPLPNEIDYKFAKKEVKGTIVANFSIDYGFQNVATLSIYVVKKNNMVFHYDEQLLLDQLKKFYYENINSNINKYALLLIDFCKNNVLFHKYIKTKS